MAKKRESRQKPRQSDATRGDKKPAKGDRDIVTVLAREWSSDRDTLRRVREWAEESESETRGKFGAVVQVRNQCATEVLAILNGTERKGNTK